jgi:hypothetical protein
MKCNGCGKYIGKERREFKLIETDDSTQAVINSASTVLCPKCGEKLLDFIDSWEYTEEDGSKIKMFEPMEDSLELKPAVLQPTP